MVQVSADCCQAPLPDESGHLTDGLRLLWEMYNPSNRLFLSSNFTLIFPKCLLRCWDKCNSTFGYKGARIRKGNNLNVVTWHMEISLFAQCMKITWRLDYRRSSIWIVHSDFEKVIIEGPIKAAKPYITLVHLLHIRVSLCLGLCMCWSG